MPTEFRLPDGTGGWRWVEGHATDLLDDPAIAGIVLHFFDVTVHHLADDALRMSEARLRSIVNNSTEGLVLVDDEGRVQWASPAAGEILGYEPEAAVGTHVLDFVHPDDIDAALPSLLRVVEGRSIGEPVQVRVRRADGHWRWVEALTKRFDADRRGAAGHRLQPPRTSPTGSPPSAPARRASCASARWSTTATTWSPWSTPPPSSSG